MTSQSEGIRELTEYEKEKWFNEYGCFDPPEALYEGSEWGELMQTLESLTGMTDGYGMSDHFAAALAVEYLDQYYMQLAGIISGDWGNDSSEDHGLPSHEDLKAKYRELLSENDEHTAALKALDWAAEWREEHLEESEARWEVKRAERELADAQRRRDGV